MGKIQPALGLGKTIGVPFTQLKLLNVSQLQSQSDDVLQDNGPDPVSWAIGR